MGAENRRTTGYTHFYTHTHTRLDLTYTTERLHKHKYAQAHSLKQIFLSSLSLSEPIFLWDFKHSICLTHAVTWTHTRMDIDSCPQLPKRICFASSNQLKSKTWPHFLSFKYVREICLNMNPLCNKWSVSIFWQLEHCYCTWVLKERLWNEPFPTIE